jgi:hypothetical protein
MCMYVCMYLCIYIYTHTSDARKHGSLALELLHKVRQMLALFSRSQRQYFCIVAFYERSYPHKV